MVHTLSDGGVEVCFANPGTSEMHTVFALDVAERFDAVLCLDEGVVAGAADGYARMAGRPAATLLHLGPGLGNAWANLHNARRARTPVVNVVGDHATYHGRYDAPLESDIGALAGAVSRWVRRPSRAEDVGPDTADAVAAAWAPPGGVATLILPADASWDEGAAPAAVAPRRSRAAVPDDVVAEAAKVLQSGERTVVLLGGTALMDAGLRAASRLAAATGALVLTQTFVARLQRGAGRPAFEALGYFAEQADAQLAGAKHLLLVDCPAPVAFFAYPGRPSSLVPTGCAVHSLGEDDEDVVAALEALVDQVAADAVPALVAARAVRGARRPASRSDRATSASPSVRPCRRGRSSSTNRSRRASGWPAARWLRHRTTGSGCAAGRSAKGCRWRRARRWPARIAGWSTCRPTAARCTRSRRCGPRPAGASTSPP